VVDLLERRKGVGTLLVESAVEWFESCGINKVELEVAEANEGGLAFWRSQGFGDFQRMLLRKL
jgi:ribosomal protein S18 acetylase RimI-like enzyme